MDFIFAYANTYTDTRCGYPYFYALAKYGYLNGHDSTHINCDAPATDRHSDCHENADRNSHIIIW